MKSAHRRVIELDEGGLTLRQVLRSLSSPQGAILRRGGCVVGRLQAIDETDVADERWLGQPPQVKRFRAARRRFEQGQGIALDEVERRLELKPRRPARRRR